ncbi:MAG TPA: hypothetical protein VN132_01830 [Bdellovibrio sp.]|nr:hypothetical protein [Bdellovibrio sp.]
MLGISALFLIIGTHFSIQSIKNEKLKPIAPPEGIHHFVFGFREAAADALWIRAIQDFDYCDQNVATNICRNNSWLGRMLDAVTNLSPKFRIPYAAGGLALTVIITDIDSATKIFEKGVKELPHDWTISYRAAYHFLYEVKDKRRAAELLIQAGKNGAPPWVFALAGRLYSDSGNTALAENLLQEMQSSHQDPALIQRLEDKINSMKQVK